MQANIPPAISIHVLSDRTQTIRASVTDVETTLLITIVLVVAVIFLFLRHVLATLIPSAVIPLAPARDHGGDAAARLQPR